MKFKYQDRVRVKRGWWKGKTGTVVNRISFLLFTSEYLVWIEGKPSEWFWPWELERVGGGDG